MTLAQFPRHILDAAVLAADAMPPYDAGVLPPLYRADGARVEPGSVDVLIRLVAAYGKTNERAILDEAIALCDRKSLADLGWELSKQARRGEFDHWYMLGAAGLFGNDDTVGRIAMALLDDGSPWDGIAASSALKEFGTNYARWTLLRIAQYHLDYLVRWQCRDALGDAHDSPVDLWFELAHDLELDGEGALRIADGELEVCFEIGTHLQPTLTCEDREVDVSDIVTTEARERADRFLYEWEQHVVVEAFMLEAAMLLQRRWTLGEFRDYLARPAALPLARSIVWAAYLEDELAAAFRVEADRTYADLDDVATTLPQSCVIGLAHPVELDVEAWTKVFVDYELVQAFEQLGRPAFNRAEASLIILSCMGRTYPHAAWDSLNHIGWGVASGRDARRKAREREVGDDVLRLEYEETRTAQVVGQLMNIRTKRLPRLLDHLEFVPSVHLSEIAYALKCGLEERAFVDRQYDPRRPITGTRGVL